MTDIPNHSLPQSIEAEEAILGAMMMSEKAIEAAASAGVRREHFARPSHRTIYDSIMRLAPGGLPDEQRVVADLRHQRVLSDVGGMAGVVSLVERVPAVSNARAYAVEVRNQATLRGLVTTGHEIARLGYEHPDSPDELVAAAGVLLDSLTTTQATSEVGFTTLADELVPFIEEAEARAKQGVTMPGVSTGLRLVDARWGGLQRGKLYVVAGRPGMGKSALSSGMGEAVALGAAEDVLIINLEMREAEQAGRALARIGDFPLERWTMGTPSDAEVQQASEFASRVYEAAQRFHFDRSTDLTVAQLRQRARLRNRELRKQGRSLRLIIVDYLQLITPPVGMKADNENAVIGHNTRNLKAMAGELDCAVLALSQLNRAVEDRPDKRPTIRDLRGSGSIEQDADVIAFLYRPEYYLKEETPAEWVNVAELNTAKFRGGRPGTDKIAWEGDFVRFSNYPPPYYVGGAA